MIKKYNTFYYLSNEEKIKRLHEEYAFGFFLKKKKFFFNLKKGNLKID